MRIFDLNLQKRIEEYHSYGTDDLALQAIGMANYTMNSLERYLYLDLASISGIQNRSLTVNPDTNTFFDNKRQEARDALLGIDFSKCLEKPSILYLENKNSYILKKEYDILKVDGTGPKIFTNIKDLLEKHNKIELGLYAPTDKEKKVINNIQTSLSGCITFRPKFKVLTCERTPLVRLYLKNRKNNDTSRTIAINGNPLIANIPSTAAGTQFSPYDTNNLPIGKYSRPREGGLNNPSNVVAAPLKTVYNPSLGKFESGTQQIIARLLEDIDAADFDKWTIDNVDNINIDNFYEPDSTKNLSSFKTGIAMTMSVENGNPYKFGPNDIGGCSSKSKIEKVRVVNRAPRSFKKGDVVMLSLIGAEWIVQGFDVADTKVQPIKISKWSFQKYIVNADSFFRSFQNTDSLNNAELGQYQNHLSDIENITPSTYEAKMRMKYYLHMFGDPNSSTPSLDGYLGKINDHTSLRTIGLLNMYPQLTLDRALTNGLPSDTSYNLYLNKHYFFSTIFDQLGKHMGGNHPIGTIIGRTNITYSPDNTKTDLLDGLKIPSFWGPVFIDGYDAQQVSNRKNNLKTITIRNNKNDELTSSLIFNKTNGPSDIFDQTQTKNRLLDNNNYMFSDDADGNAKQLPAEAALLGNIDDQSTPSYSIEKTLESIDQTKNTVQEFENYLRDSGRYIYLADSGNKDIYGFKPVQPNKLQFSPLPIELALSHVDPTRVTPDSLGRLLTLEGSIQSLKNLYNQQDPSGKPLFFFGQMFKRENNNTEPEPLLSTFEATSVETYIPFGPYDISYNSTRPAGGPGLIPDSKDGYEKSNLMGIIASKMKFAASPNGSLTFTTNQYFGLPPRVTIGGGQTTLVTVLGNFLSFGGFGNPARQNGIPQWGDITRTDGVDSWGTTALHVRIFDQWPDRDTIYDGRYFSVLHFNPNLLPDNYMRIDKLGNDFTGFVFGSNEDIRGIDSNTNIAWKIENSGTDNSTLNWNTSRPLPANYKVKVEVEETSVDFREPSYIDMVNNSIVEPKRLNVDQKIYPSGFIDNDANKRLAPQSQWKINPIRRGRLLTGGGFRYQLKEIGAGQLVFNSRTTTNDSGDEVTTTDNGISYVNGDLLIIEGHGTVIDVKVNNEGAITSIFIVDPGNGYDDTDFDSVFNLTNIPGSGSESGSGAKVKLQYLKVHNRTIKTDNGPTERCPITRLSLPSDYEQKAPAQGALTTTIPLTGGNGKYDAFYFFHNDVLHTLTDFTGFSPGYAQYINLEIATN